MMTGSVLADLRPVPVGRVGVRRPGLCGRFEMSPVAMMVAGGGHDCAGAAVTAGLLFGDVSRDDDRPRSFDESTFSFLNRRSGAMWQRVRDLLDEWFCYVPGASRADLRGRLESGAEADFRSAFFELYCREIFRRSGWDLEHHPVLAHTTRRPDFRASRRSVTAYVEVTTTSPPRLDAASEARLNVMMDAINDRMEIDHFMLGIDVVSVGNDCPPAGPLSGKLRAWLSTLNADQLIAAGGDNYSSESIEWVEGGWHLNFKAYPLPADRRDPGGRIIGTWGPAEASIVDDVTPIRKRVASKAKAYGELKAPFVIAIDAVSQFTGDDDFLSAFYGTSAVVYYQNAGPGAPPPTWIRKLDGLWVKRDGWHQSQVSAVLASTTIMPWTWDRQPRRSGTTQVPSDPSTRSVRCCDKHG